jgi:hypothetical protein
MFMILALKIAAFACGIIFAGLGLAWWISPSFPSDQLGMPLLTGVALSSQIGDFGSFFLTLGGCILIGLARNEKIWMYPPVMLLAFAAVGRTIAWIFYGASLTLGMIALEASAALLLLLTSSSLSKSQFPRKPI